MQLTSSCFIRMNRVSLYSIGIAGFGHEFGGLDGKRSDIEEAFDSFGTAPPINMIISLLGAVIPLLQKIPTHRRRLSQKLHTTMEQVSDEILQRSRIEKGLGVDCTNTSRSVIGSLRKSDICL